jgi:hypothetical protein
MFTTNAEADIPGQSGEFIFKILLNPVQIISDTRYQAFSLKLTFL